MKVKINRVRGGSMGDQRNYGLVTGSIWNYENKTASNNVGTTLSPVPRDEATIEAERGETVIGDLDNDGMVEHAKIGGKRHSHGGTPLNVPDGSFVFSDYSKLRIKNEDLLKGIFNMSSKKAVTPAKVAQRYDLNRYKQILNDPDSDPMDKKTAQLMIDNNMKKLGQLALIQEGMKGFPDGIPAIAMPLLQGAPQSGGGQKQMMRKGGVVKYRKGGLARYQGAEQSEVSEQGPQVPMRALPPSRDTEAFTPNPNDLAYVGTDPEFGDIFQNSRGEHWYMDPSTGNWVNYMQGPEIVADRTTPPNDFGMDYDGDGQVTMSDFRAYDQYKQQQGNRWNLSDQFQDPARNIFGVDNERSNLYNLALGFSPVGLMSIGSDINNNIVRPAIYGEEEQPYESVLTEDYINRKLAENPNQPTSYTSDSPTMIGGAMPGMLSIPMYATGPRSVDGYKWPLIGGAALAAAGLPRNYNPYGKVYRGGKYILGPKSPIFGELGILDMYSPNSIAQTFLKPAGKKLLEWGTWSFRKRPWQDLQPLGTTKQPLWDKIRRKPFTPQPIVGPLTHVNQSPFRRFLGSKGGRLGLIGAGLGLVGDYLSEDISNAGRSLYNWATDDHDQVDFGKSGEFIPTNGESSPTTTTTKDVTPVPYDMDELNITNSYQDSITKSLKNNGVKDTTQGSTTQGSTKELSDDEKLDKYLRAIGYSQARIDSMDRDGKVYLYNRGKKSSDQIKKLGGENNLITYKKKGEVKNANRHDPDAFPYATQNTINALKAKGFDLSYAPFLNIYGNAAGSQVNDPSIGEVYVNTPNSFWIGGSDDPADMDTKVLAWYKDHPAFKDQWKNYPGGYDGWVKDAQLLSKYRNESSDWPEAYEKWAKSEGRQDPDEWLVSTYDDAYYKPITGEYYFNDAKERDATGKLTTSGKIKGRKVQGVPIVTPITKTEKKKKDDDGTTTNTSATAPNPQFQPSRYYGLGEPFPGELAAYQAALGQRIPRYEIADYDMYPSLVSPLYKDPNLEFLSQVTQNVQGEGTGPAARASSTGVVGKALDAATKLIAQNRALNDDIYLKSAAYNANALNEANKINLSGDLEYLDKANAYSEALTRDLNKKDAGIAKTIGPLHKSMLWQAATEAQYPNVDVSPWGYQVRGTAPNIGYSPTGGGSSYQAIWDAAYARFLPMTGGNTKDAAKMATEYARGAMTKSKAGTGDIAYSPYDVD